MGVRAFRQVNFKPYRVIYRVIDPQAFVLVIADGRRNLKTLLERRLLGALWPVDGVADQQVLQHGGVFEPLEVLEDAGYCPARRWRAAACR